ncbi:YkgJ family cysteine cluster protein [Paraburkholderia caballeronis]|uniref:YkgJ family cysteine cluster protein n=1 Tax=Paraburkholderia caballeronis TaxID=416943 RepID=UPI0010664B18|nr:YkgJ family cysteine cluster protein [Paraburkholderia caballeronis]
MTIAHIEQILAEGRQRADAQAARALPDLPEGLRAEHEKAVAFARSQEETVQQRLDADRPTLTMLVNATQDGKLPRETRMAWLRKLADRINQLAQSLSACATNHCSHCCYAPVSLSFLEAKLIGAAIGVEPKAPPAQTARHAASATPTPLRPKIGHGYAWPCPFLVEDASLPSGKGGKCGIYEHRPMVCRSCLSMAASDKLCEPQPDHLVPLPLFDARVLHLLAAQIGGAEVADIRDFFPAGMAG